MAMYWQRCNPPPKRLKNKVEQKCLLGRKSKDDVCVFWCNFKSKTFLLARIALYAHLILISVNTRSLIAGVLVCLCMSVRWATVLRVHSISIRYIAKICRSSTKDMSNRKIIKILYYLLYWCIGPLSKMCNLL